MNHSAFRGTGVALITPFTSQGAVDFNALEKLVNFNIENGIQYFVVLGTTGESSTLSKTEKKDVWKAVATFNAGRIPLVAGIGGNHTGQVMEDLQQFDGAGYSAILSVSPYYNKPQQEGIYRHYMKLQEVTPLPLILYNVPGRTGSNITAQTALRLARDSARIIGIKEASGNFSQIMAIGAGRPADFLLISGDDLITLPLMSFGCDGVISVVAQAFPSWFSTLVTKALQGDFREAARLQFQLLPYMEWLFEEGSPAGVKAALNLLGICENVLRLPLVPVSDALFEKLRASMGK